MWDRNPSYTTSLASLQSNWQDKDGACGKFCSASDIRTFQFLVFPKPFVNIWRTHVKLILSANLTGSAGTKPILLGMLVGDILKWSIWSRNTHPKPGRKKLLYICLPSFSMESSSILLLRHSFACIRTNFFRSPVQTDHQELSGDPLGLQGHTA